MDEKKYELTPEQRVIVNHAVDRILDENKRKRKGARVFCVGCGGGQRTPLRKWRKGYICVNCWKMKEAIGEDAFILRVKKNLLGE